MTDCTCPMTENEIITRFAVGCPEHGSLATPAKTIIQRWCSGSSEPVYDVSGRTGICRFCNNVVPQKYGHAGSHLPDGSTPRE